VRSGSEPLEYRSFTFCLGLTNQARTRQKRFGGRGVTKERMYTQQRFCGEQF
jgi:hypothetical protein